MRQGHYVSHIRRMRQVYGERRRVLIDEIARRMGGALSVLGSDAGLQDAAGQLVLVGNGRLYGGTYRVFPDADFCDGKLDVCVFPQVNWPGLFGCGFYLLLRGRPRRVAAGGSGISRFPGMVVPSVHGVCDRAGFVSVSRWRRSRCGLPLLLTASAPRRVLSRLNTRPVRSPVDASTTPSRAPPHDPGPAWFASPSPYETFIHTTMPV